MTQKEFPRDLEKISYCLALLIWLLETVGNSSGGVLQNQLIKNKHVTQLFHQIEPKKNGASLSFPSSTTRNSSASNANRIFEFLWGILEGRTIWPFLKNCQNSTFWSVHGIWKFFGPNDFIWSAWKVPFYDFIQNVFQAPSMCISMWIRVNKWNYLKNPSRESKNSFCFRFLRIFRKTGKQN